jgi:hypothetical protein
LCLSGHTNRVRGLVLRILYIEADIRAWWHVRVWIVMTWAAEYLLVSRALSAVGGSAWSLHNFVDVLSASFPQGV